MWFVAVMHVILLVITGFGISSKNVAVNSEYTSDLRLSLVTVTSVLAYVSCFAAIFHT